MSPIDVACGHYGCDAQPGTPCSWEHATEELYHEERLELADRMITQGSGYSPTKDEYDAAVGNSGDV